MVVEALRTTSDSAVRMVFGIFARFNGQSHPTFEKIVAIALVFVYFRNQRTFLRSAESGFVAFRELEGAPLFRFRQFTTLTIALCLGACE